MGAERVVYNRELLLLGAKRYAELSLDEVHQYGTDSYGDPDYVSLYGLHPAEWYARGVRVLGRTAVECTRDALADLIGRDVAATARGASVRLVLDPFAGSANTLYWMLRHLPGARGLGCELDAQVFERTRRNLALVDMPLDLRCADYSEVLREMEADDSCVVAFIAPPWGAALDPVAGLDLRHTTPPVVDILDAIATRFGRNPLLFAIQVFERVVPAGLQDVTARGDWSALRIYDLNAEGQRHGLLLLARNWPISYANVRNQLDS